MLMIDDHGLDEMDFRILSAIVHQFDGGPVGLQTLAMAVRKNLIRSRRFTSPF